MTKIENKIGSVQNKKKSFAYNKDIILTKLTLVTFPSLDDSKKAQGGRYSYFVNSKIYNISTPFAANQRRPVEPNSMWQHRLTRPLHAAYGNSQTKFILNYFKRGSALNLNGFSVKIFFCIRY